MASPRSSTASVTVQYNNNNNFIASIMLQFIALLLLLPSGAVAKNLDDTAAAAAAGIGHHHSHADFNKETIRQRCDSVKDYFQTIDIKLDGNFEHKGPICGGHCCSNSTEVELRQKSTSDLERLLHHHTKSLRGILESTSSLFRNHVLELAEQSENKTLNVFSQVYRRMLPLSRQLIHNMYSEVISHLKSSNEPTTMTMTTTTSTSSLEDAVHKFFVDLFPVAYHQAVHLNKNNYGDLHEDYISCLKHTFDDLQPFGRIPREISRNLVQSVNSATVFMNALEQSAEVLSGTDHLDAMYLTATCQKQLLKISYCPSCNGHAKKLIKSCYSYCLNVMRGCLAQYVGVLDSPWSNVAEAIEHLVTTFIQSDNGIVNTIKMLDSKLSETIMLAMENGPELEMKVKKTCGTPKLLPSAEQPPMEMRSGPQTTIKWATPPDAELLHFLSTIEKSKEFYSRIVNNVCEDEDIQRNDRHCWTGDRIGDYTQLVMTTGLDAQKYNPEVPLAQHSYAQSTKLNELVDKLLKIRSTIGNAIPSSTRAYSDIQGDMARHDEEGSGRLPDDADDEEYSSIHGSGDGSGDGGPTSTPEDPSSPTSGYDNKESRGGGGGGAAATSSITFRIETLAILVTLTAIINECFFASSSSNH